MNDSSNIEGSWHPTVDEVANALDPVALLGEVEQMIVSRIDALQTTSRRGCQGLQLMGVLFELQRAHVNARARNERAFLDDASIMRAATGYDMMNYDGKRIPLSYMVFIRGLIQNRIEQSQLKD